jgi:hypothetical protein
MSRFSLLDLTQNAMSFITTNVLDRFLLEMQAYDWIGQTRWLNEWRMYYSYRNTFDGTAHETPQVSRRLHQSTTFKANAANYFVLSRFFHHPCNLRFKNSA